MSFMLNIKHFEVNPLQENCYVVSDDTKECMIVDCGAFYPQEIQAITNYILENLFHTHSTICYHWYEALPVTLIIVSILYPIILICLKRMPILIGGKKL